MVLVSQVPSERILLETDAPDALPKLTPPDLLYPVEGDSSGIDEHQTQQGSSNLGDAPASQKGTLNHPANILNVSSLVH